MLPFLDEVKTGVPVGMVAIICSEHAKYMIILVLYTYVLWLFLV